MDDDSEKSGWCGMTFPNSGDRPCYVGPLRADDHTGILASYKDVRAVRSVLVVPGTRAVLRRVTESERAALVG